MKDYTQNGKIKIVSTYEPTKRPTYEQWIKELKISHAVYDTDPQAKERAQEIKSKMGIRFDSRNTWQVLLGEEY